MPSSQPLTIVIRIPDVALSRSDLNASLGLQVDRYEASSGRAYAQIDIADHGDKWAAALDLIQSIRAFIRWFPGMRLERRVTRSPIEIFRRVHWPRRHAQLWRYGTSIANWIANWGK